MSQTLSDDACTKLWLKSKVLAMRMIKETRADVQDRASLKAAPLVGLAPGVLN